MSSLFDSRFGHGPRRFYGVHGWGSTGAQSFGSIAAFIPEDCTLIAPDLPGCGQSPPPSQWLMSQVDEELLAHFDQVSAESSDKLTLVGSCSGSFNALPLAAARPERIERVVLLEPFAFMPWFFSIFLTPVAGPLLYKTVFDNPIGRAMTRRGLRRQGGDEEKVDMVGSFASSTDLTSAYNYLRFYGEIVDHTAFASAPEPITLVYGEKTFKAIHHSIELWKQNWPALATHMIPEVGHMLSHEAPDVTAALVFSAEDAQALSERSPEAIHRSGRGAAEQHAAP